MLIAKIYKVYAIILAGRLEEEVEKKRIVPHNQTDFRNKSADNG